MSADKTMTIKKFKSNAVWNGTKYDWGKVDFVPPKGKGIEGWNYKPMNGGDFQSVAGAVRSINHSWKTEWFAYKGNVLFVIYEAKFVGGPGDGQLSVTADVYQGL